MGKSEHIEPLPIYTLDEAAVRLRMSRRFLQDLVKDNPFYFKKGRQKMFTDEDIQNLIKAMRCPSKSSSEARAPTTTFEVHGRTESPSSRVLKLMTSQQQKPSERRSRPVG